jgi:teichuronic acid biosynthesis glycosyltransferase TuaC
MGPTLAAPMKILVLTKRQYMGKDLLDDRFGRFWELPFELARLGHQVGGICLSYRPRKEGMMIDERPSTHGRVIWQSVNLTHLSFPRLFRYAGVAVDFAEKFKPDAIWACSDAYHAIIGAWLARRIRTRCIVDLYDNFEAFTASKMPLVIPLFRRAAREADGVTCFSVRLAKRVMQTYGRQKPTRVVESGVRKDLFYPLDRQECRRWLNLPENATIIGTAGALSRSRGIETLFRAFQLLGKEHSDIHLALAGAHDKGLRIPKDVNVHDLGTLPHEKIPVFIGALDVSVICYRHSAQGEYSFPQKAYEIIACRAPLVAAAVGSMNELLQNYPHCLYEPENPASLADAISRQLRAKTVIQGRVPSWADSAKLLSNFFAEVINRSSAAVPPDATLVASA